MEQIKTEVARYISKYAQLRLVRKASYNKEIDGRVVAMPGESIQFTDGIFETSDKDVIEFLDNHKNLTTALKKGVFMKIPNSSEAKALRDKQMETLEERTKRLDAREEEIKRKEAKLGIEEGSDVKKVVTTDTTPKVNSRMKIDDLVSIAKEEGVEIEEGATKVDIVKAIEEAREKAPKGTGQSPKF